MNTGELNTDNIFTLHFKKLKIRSIKLILKFRELILYGVIGCFSSGLDLIAFTILTNIGIYYIVANIVSVIIGISTSFTLNRKYNFKVKDRTLHRFAIFLLVGLAGLVLSTVILWYTMTRLNVIEPIAKIISIVGVVVFQFILNKYITFKEK